MDSIDIKFIYTQESLLKIMQEYSKNAKTIKFYCSNFESYHNNNTIDFEFRFVRHLLDLVSQKINIEVFSYNSLDIKNIITQSSQKTYYLKHNLKISDEAKRLMREHIDNQEITVSRNIKGQEE